MKTVIFDLDGTLADTSADLIAAANACFTARGYGALLDPVKDALVAFHGGRAMLMEGYGRLGLEEGHRAELAANDYKPLLAYYAENIDVETRLYPGVEAALDELDGLGYALGICTNKPADLAEELTARLGIRDIFASLVGADTLPVRKPDPAPYVASVERAGGTVARSLLIGDTKTDRETARAAGVASVLVTFGPEGEEIARLNPEALLHHYDDLPALVRKLLG